MSTGTKRTAVFKESKGGLLRGVLPALLITVALGAMLLFVAALSLSISDDPTVFTRPVGCAIGALCAFLGGLIAGKRERQAGALAGLLFGILFLLILFVVGRIFGDGTDVWVTVIAYTVLLLLAVLGGLAGSSNHKSGKRHRRHR